MPKRNYRRRTHYPGHLSAVVTEATQEAVEEVADRAGWSVAQAVRECIEVGLPAVQSHVGTSSRNSLRAASVEKT